MNHPHKKKEPFPGQGERRTEIRLQAKLRRRSDVMLGTFTNNNGLNCNFGALIAS